MFHMIRSVVKRFPKNNTPLSRGIRYGHNLAPQGKKVRALCPNKYPGRTMQSIIGIASIRGGCVVSWLSEIASNPLNPRIFQSLVFFSLPPAFLLPVPTPLLPSLSPSLTVLLSPRTTSPHGGAGEARFLALPKTACGRDGASTCVGARHVERKWGYSTWRLYTHRAQQCTNARAASTPV